MDVCYQVGELPVQRFSKSMGSMPVMVKSRACHLRHMSRAELVKAKEESTEMGGYFICNGIERIIRLLIQQRRHYIMALKRGSYQKRGVTFTDMATIFRSEISLVLLASKIQFRWRVACSFGNHLAAERCNFCRCVRIDERSDSVRCHYLTDGTVTVALTIRRSEFFIPAALLLKCFVEVTDREIFDKLVRGAIVVSLPKLLLFTSHGCCH